ncbi:MAG: hypothetical protein ACFFAO_21070, partial [Candidatus Hermodarchaeota archaeon]
MSEYNWLIKRLKNTKESTLEWIGTFFFIAGFLFLILLFNYVNETEPSVIRTMVQVGMIIFGAIYSLYFLGALGSFFPEPKKNKTPFDQIESIDFFRNH